MQPVDLAGLIESNAPDNPRHSYAHYDTGNQEQRDTVGDPPPRDIPPGMENTRAFKGAHKTARISSTNASPPSPSFGGGERAKAPERIEQTRPPVRRIKIPADVDASLQRKASSLKRTEAKLRLQRQISQKYGGRENLSPRERARLTSRLGETTYLDGERGDVAGRSDGEHADVPVGNYGDSGVPRETASRSMNIERKIGRLALEADRSNSDPSGSSNLPNVVLPNTDRLKLPRPVDLPDLKRANLPKDTPDDPSASSPNGTPDLDLPKREKKKRIEPKYSEDSGRR